MNGAPFRVIWRRSVLGHTIAGIVLELVGRGESTEPLFAAVDRITRLLTSAPESRGESRPRAERVFHIPPLTVTFEVHPDERLVFVVEAHYVRPHGRRTDA